ncbi:chondroadherin-like protein [Synchiropus splendidus]|uniref:chondroadherin-like protein n=1 Tax=Synchiropus splendidus TaxID=270530 RepID=UPI00237D50F1|nr:chondroadherin-like protein [Synchiropus splendidus]
MALLALLVLVATSVLTVPVETSKCPSVCSCDSKTLSVSCVGRNLKQVPPTIDEITVKLDLRNNALEQLPRGAFLHTPYLTHLNLQRCNIMSVKEGAFRALGRLVSLNLAFNKIHILFQESFDGLSALKELNLEHNRLEEIQPGAFMQLGSLNLLVLTHNQLVYIPNMAFQGLHNIKWLHLSHNSINNLAAEAFASLFALARLSLDHNELQFFPVQAMNRLREVTRLELSHNPMIYLGEESIIMPKLTHLHLDHMSLQDLSQQAFSGAPLLSVLDLSYNQLRHLEPLSGPKELSSLDLTGNPVYCNCYLRPLRNWARTRGVKLQGVCSGPPHLADEPLGMVAAVDLRCRSRGGEMKEEEEEEGTAGRSAPRPTAKPIIKCPARCQCDVEGQHATCEGRGHTKVPRGFPAKTQLLDLRSNSFHHLPSDTFKGAAKVLSLHLENCSIQEVESGAFQGMKHLYYLYLSDNLLTFLEAGAFAGAPQLTYLHLEGNRLTQVPGPALSQLPSLFVLHLERNNISTLQPSGLMTSMMPELRELYLSNNSLMAITDGSLDSAFLRTLHLAWNRLNQVPTRALSKTPNLEELDLSQNPVDVVGPGAFLPISQSLKRLHMDHMNMRKLSRDALSGLGSALRALTVRGNQLEELPDLRPLKHLEVLDLEENPLRCDCSLMPLHRWMENVSLEVSATCGHPPELQGHLLKDVQVFKSCPEHSPLSQEVKVQGPPQARGKTKVSKATKPRSKAGNKPVQRKPAAPRMTKKKTAVSKRDVAFN